MTIFTSLCGTRRRRLALAVAAISLLGTRAGAWAATGKANPKTHHSLNATRTIAKFGDWRVAAHGQGASLVCYAYTRAIKAGAIKAGAIKAGAAKTGALAGRGEVALTVTERPALRDSVAISAGFLLTTRKDVSLRVGSEEAGFYPGGRLVFARQGAAALNLLATGSSATMILPSPTDGDVQDQFSLEGFAAALAAARKACPAEAHR